MSDGRIEAAGGVLWRRTVDGIEVALVHRPKYDDWSLPKGKLARGEHPLLAAVREVQEETGFVGVPGLPMSESHYLKDGQPKRVRYWAMRVGGGAFVANDEVDELVWLPPAQAQQRLLPERDQHVLNDADSRCVSTWPCLLVRHASAGSRECWDGPDAQRPLDDHGRDQARTLAALLGAYRVELLASSDVTRCFQTLEPFARTARLPIATDVVFSETGSAADPGLAANRLFAIAGAQVPSALCGHASVLAELTKAMRRQLAPHLPDPERLPKASALIVHLRRQRDHLELVQFERLDVQ